MSDIPIQWKKITRVLPKIGRHADDRAPTIEEIKNKFSDTKKFDKIKFLGLKFEEKNIKQIVDIVND
jgi:hypothetical protein